jgi:hypothetical protein
MITTLSGCVEEEVIYDYSDFSEHAAQSYEELENSTENRYVAYYYSETCGHCADVKQEILTFFSDFDDMPFYILDVARATDTSGLDEFYGTPTVFIISNNEVISSFIGSVGVRDFIEMFSDYENLDLDYVDFQNQHLFRYVMY